MGFIGRPLLLVRLLLVYALVPSVWTFHLSSVNIGNSHQCIFDGTDSARRRNRDQQFFSTPFEVDYYDDMDNPYDSDGRQSSSSSLAVSPNTKLVVGLNKYSHDTTICAANAETGDVLFAISKERLTRKKHDSGNVAILVDTCLSCLNLDLDSISKVVVNNHHHRVLPLEANRRHLEWESGLRINGGEESGYEDDENLLDHAEQVSFIRFRSLYS